MVKVRKPRGGYCKKYSAGLTGKPKANTKGKKYIKLIYNVDIDSPKKLWDLKRIKAHRITINKFTVNVTVLEQHKTKVMDEIKQKLIELGATGYYINILYPL